MKKNLKLIIFLAVQLSIVLTIILIVLFAGKKMYTVTFNLNGGNHVSGELVQTVRFGKSATPPVVTRDGCYLYGWNQPYNVVTSDMTITAIWEYETTIGVEFEVIPNSDYCLISGCYKNIAGDVYVGAHYQGKKVLGIKDGAFKDCKYITGIYLLDGIISIGDEAFAGCTSLKRVNIPSTVTTIGENVLANCSSLEAISVPFVGDSLYNNTKPFFGYFFGGTSYSNGYNKVPSKLKYVDITTDQPISDYAFYKCSKINILKIFGDVESIGLNAFRNCSSIRVLSLPDSVKYIGDAAFANCSALTEVAIPNSIENLNSAVFANCTSLEKVTIGSNLKTIEDNTFQNCSNLKNFEVEDNSNFLSLNNKLFIIDGKNIEEYIIYSEVYKDDLDKPPFIVGPSIGPIIGPIKDPNLGLEKEEIEDLFPQK